MPVEQCSSWADVCNALLSLALSSLENDADIAIDVAQQFGDGQLASSIPPTEQPRLAVVGVNDASYDDVYIPRSFQVVNAGRATAFSSSQLSSATSPDCVLSEGLRGHTPASGHWTGRALFEGSVGWWSSTDATESHWGVQFHDGLVYLHSMHITFQISQTGDGDSDVRVHSPASLTVDIMDEGPESSEGPWKAHPVDMRITGEGHIVRIVLDAHVRGIRVNLQGQLETCPHDQGGDHPRPTTLASLLDPRLKLRPSGESSGISRFDEKRRVADAEKARLAKANPPTGAHGLKAVTFYTRPEAQLHVHTSLPMALMESKLAGIAAPLPVTARRAPTAAGAGLAEVPAASRVAAIEAQLLLSLATGSVSCMFSAAHSLLVLDAAFPNTCIRQSVAVQFATRVAELADSMAAPPNFALSLHDPWAGFRHTVQPVFDPDCKGESMRLVSSPGLAGVTANRRARSSGASSTHAAAYGLYGFCEGKVSWTFRLSSDSQSDEHSCLGFGTRPLTDHSYQSSRNLCLIRSYTGGAHERGSTLSSVTLPKIHQGDRLRFEAAFTTPSVGGKGSPDKGTVSVWHNDAPYGVVFRGIDGLVIFPAMSSYGTGVEVEFVALEPDWIASSSAVRGNEKPKSLIGGRLGSVGEEPHPLYALTNLPSFSNLFSSGNRQGKSSSLAQMLRCQCVPVQILPRLASILPDGSSTSISSGKGRGSEHGKDKEMQRQGELGSVYGIEVKPTSQDPMPAAAATLAVAAGNVCAGGFVEPSATPLVNARGSGALQAALNEAGASRGKNTVGIPVTVNGVVSHTGISMQPSRSAAPSMRQHPDAPALLQAHASFLRLPLTLSVPEDLMLPLQQRFAQCLTNGDARTMSTSVHLTGHSSRARLGGPAPRARAFTYLTGRAGVDDTSPARDTLWGKLPVADCEGTAMRPDAVVMQIWGNATLLWQSRPLCTAGESQPFRVCIRGCDTMTLAAVYADPDRAAHPSLIQWLPFTTPRTVWLDAAVQAEEWTRLGADDNAMFISPLGPALVSQPSWHDLNVQAREGPAVPSVTGHLMPAPTLVQRAAVKATQKARTGGGEKRAAIGLQSHGGIGTFNSTTSIAWDKLLPTAAGVGSAAISQPSHTISSEHDEMDALRFSLLPSFIDRIDSKTGAEAPSSDADGCAGVRAVSLARYILGRCAWLASLSDYKARSAIATWGNNVGKDSGTENLMRSFIAAILPDGLGPMQTTNDHLPSAVPAAGSMIHPVGHGSSGVGRDIILTDDRPANPSHGLLHAVQRCGAYAATSSSSSRAPLASPVDPASLSTSITSLSVLGLGLGEGTRQGPFAWEPDVQDECSRDVIRAVAATSAAHDPVVPLGIDVRGPALQRLCAILASCLGPAMRERQEGTAPAMPAFDFDEEGSMEGYLSGLLAQVAEAHKHKDKEKIELEKKRAASSILVSPTDPRASVPFAPKYTFGSGAIASGAPLPTFWARFPQTLGKSSPSSSPPAFTFGSAVSAPTPIPLTTMVATEAHLGAFSFSRPSPLLFPTLAPASSPLTASAPLAAFATPPAIVFGAARVGGVGAPFDFGRVSQGSAVPLSTDVMPVQRDFASSFASSFQARKPSSLAPTEGSPSSLVAAAVADATVTPPQLMPAEETLGARGAAVAPGTCTPSPMSALLQHCPPLAGTGAVTFTPSHGLRYVPACYATPDAGQAGLVDVEAYTAAHAPYTACARYTLIILRACIAWLQRAGLSAAAAGLEENRFLPGLERREGGVPEPSFMSQLARVGAGLGGGQCASFLASMPLHPSHMKDEDRKETGMGVGMEGEGDLPAPLRDLHAVLEVVCEGQGGARGHGRGPDPDCSSEESEEEEGEGGSEQQGTPTTRVASLTARPGESHRPEPPAVPGTLYRMPACLVSSSSRLYEEALPLLFPTAAAMRRLMRRMLEPGATTELDIPFSLPLPQAAGAPGLDRRLHRLLLLLQAEAQRAGWKSAVLHTPGPGPGAGRARLFIRLPRCPPSPGLLSRFSSFGTSPHLTPLLASLPHGGGGRSPLSMDSTPDRHSVQHGGNLPAGVFLDAGLARAFERAGLGVWSLPSGCTSTAADMRIPLHIERTPVKGTGAGKAEPSVSGGHARAVGDGTETLQGRPLVPPATAAAAPASGGSGAVIRLLLSSAGSYKSIVSAARSQAARARPSSGHGKLD